jgi:hypothetical protein
MRIVERRVNASPIDYDLTAAESAIYRACDAGATSAAAHAALAPADQRDVTAAEVEAFLDRLVDLRLMYREGARFLALAVRSTSACATHHARPDSACVMPLRLVTGAEGR